MSYNHFTENNTWKTVRSQPIADNMIGLCKYEVRQHFQYVQSGIVQPIKHIEQDFTLSLVHCCCLINAIFKKQVHKE
jgi:hypothetical protein